MVFYSETGNHTGLKFISEIKLCIVYNNKNYFNFKYLYYLFSKTKHPCFTSVYSLNNKNII